MNLRILTAVALIALASSALATPSRSNSQGCIGCHNPVTGRMSIIAPGGLTTNLGTQLDGQSRGALDTFEVIAGQSVTIPIVVAAGSGTFALGVYEIADGGVKNSLGNLLDFSLQTPPNWTLRSGPARYTYPTTSLSAAAQTINFRMLVTPPRPRITMTSRFNGETMPSKARPSASTFT